MYRYGIIGTGRPHRSEGATGFGMAYPHARGFLTTGKAELVAVADIREDNARLFLESSREKYGSSARHYLDYHEMLEREHLDIVSICTWPHLHAEMTIAAAEAGVKAIHCEKPMATTWGDCKRMKAAADAHGAVLTFDHQRRFLNSFQRARQLISEGAIGELREMEARCGNLSDWGTHWIDMLFFFNHETPAEWVLAQIESKTDRRVYGAFTEDQSICRIGWTNGVRGLLFGERDNDLGRAFLLTGSEGMLDIVFSDPCLRIRGKGDADWREIDTGEGLHDGVSYDRGCADLVRALEEPGYLPLLRVENAIRTAEVIFAAYESSRRRGRIDLPLQPEDSALITMREQGLIGPDRKD